VRRLAVSSSVWLGLSRAIELSNVVIFPPTLKPKAERAENKQARGHESAAQNEKCLSDRITPAEEYAGEAEDEQSETDANPSRRKLTRLRRPKTRLHEALPIVGSSPARRIKL